MVTCKFSNCSFWSSSRLGIVNHEKQCKYNATILSNRSTTKKVNTTTITTLTCADPAVRQSKKFDHLEKIQPVDNEEEPEFVFDVGEDEENYGVTVDSNDNVVEKEGQEVNDAQRVIETIAVNFCIIEKKVGIKTVNAMIKSISNKDFDRERFVEQIKDMSDCKMKCCELVRQTFEDDGYSEYIVKTIDGKYETKLYTKDIVQVLCNQLKESNENNFHFHPVKKNDANVNEIFSHLLETKYGRELQKKLRKRL